MARVGLWAGRRGREHLMQRLLLAVPCLGSPPLTARHRPPCPPACTRPPAGKAAKEGGSASPENQFIRGTIALHDKYMEYVQVGGRVAGW